MLPSPLTCLTVIILASVLIAWSAAWIYRPLPADEHEPNWYKRCGPLRMKHTGKPEYIFNGCREYVVWNWDDIEICEELPDPMKRYLANTRDENGRSN